jgi:hypothetical protein
VLLSSNGQIATLLDIKIKVLSRTQNGYMAVLLGEPFEEAFLVPCKTLST